MWITTAQHWNKLLHTHRTSCRRPRGPGEVNTSPQWISVLAPIYSLPQQSEFPFTQHQSVAQNTPLSLARRSFPPLQKSRLKTVLKCEQKPYPVWFCVGPRTIRYIVNIDLAFNSVLKISLVCLTLLFSFSSFHMLIALHSKRNFTFRALTYAHLR